jgi:trafficking protein particle complex subunit 3
MIAKVGFKMFLGITAEVINWTDASSSSTTSAPPSSPTSAPPPASAASASHGSSSGTGFSLLFTDNPLTDFVELPPQYASLCYCNLLCGVIKGALEMIQLQVDCRFVRDVLKGDEVTEMRVELRGVMANTMSEEYTRET